MELAVLTLFAVLLIGALAAGVPILYALIAGLILFSAYSLKCGFTLEQTGKMCLKGVNTVKNVLITMTIIGVLTGLWRSSGTIPAIVGYCVQLITPSVFLLLTFLLNSLVSFLIGYLYFECCLEFSDRNFLWNGSHYGSHLYCHGPGNGYKPCPCRRRSYIRRLFRGPVFACIHQHSACGRSDPYGYV